MRSALPFLCCFVVSTAHADALAERVRACAQLQDAEQRLACFDAEASRLSTSARPVPVEAEFGSRSPVLAKQKEKDDGPERIEAVVKAVANRPHGEAVLTLDNGQVWEQIGSQPQLALHAGDKVSIEGGALRSYRLITASGRGARVTRIE